MTYAQFRTGLTFRQIRAELRAESNAAYAAGVYKWVTRRTVLGRWHQHKRDLWDYYLNTREKTNEQANSNAYAQSRAANG